MHCENFTGVLFPAAMQIPLTSHPSGRQEGYVQLSIAFQAQGSMEGLSTAGTAFRRTDVHGVVSSRAPICHGGTRSAGLQLAALCLGSSA
jgi:hypothetical protein